MSWRLIDDGRHGAFYNMALDEAISRAVRDRLSPPTLRIYQWLEPSVSIGCFQKVSEINSDYCGAMGYCIVRRSTGGKAIMHDSDLTYSFSARTDLPQFVENLLQNYMIISNALVSALRRFDLDAKISVIRNRRQRSVLCFKTTSYGEITVKGKKLIGSAQRRYRNSFLQQGTVLMDFNTEEMKKVFNSSDRLSDLHEIDTMIRLAPSVTVRELRSAVKKGFEDVFGIRLLSGDPTEIELRLAETLVTEKYSQERWNSRR